MENVYHRKLQLQKYISHIWHYLNKHSYDIAYLTWQLKEAVEILPSCFKHLKGTINTCQLKHYKL